MKKFYVLLLAGVSYGSGLFGQAYIGQVDKGKTLQTGAAIRLSYASDQVENALKAYLAGKGFKPTSSRGYIVYRAVPLGTDDKDGSDLYFCTARPDRKQKDMMVLGLVPARRNQDVGTGVFTDSTKLDAAKAFLDSLAPFVNTYGLGVLVNTQQEALTKAQKKMSDLRDDSTDLQKRLRDLQADLAQNKSDQVKAAADLQTYIGADNDTKSKYQKRMNKLIDKQGSLEKKIRKTQNDIADNKSDLDKQQSVVVQQQQGLDAAKARQ